MRVLLKKTRRAMFLLQKRQKKKKRKKRKKKKLKPKSLSKKVDLKKLASDRKSFLS